MTQVGGKYSVVRKETDQATIGLLKRFVKKLKDNIRGEDEKGYYGIHKKKDDQIEIYVRSFKKKFEYRVHILIKDKAWIGYTKMDSSLKV